MSTYLRLGMVPAYLALCLLLGGASAAGYWANLTLQLIAIAIILWAVLAQRKTPVSSASWQLIAIASLIVLAIVMQLIPLPPGVWPLLPGREQIARGYELLNQSLPWIPISLAPRATIASGLWLLPALAILLAILRLGNFTAVGIAWVISLITAASVALGALQIAGGTTSPWYIYRITNHGQTTGFFANSNHMATLLVVSIPFLAALYVTARSRGRSAQRTSGMLVVLAGALAVVLFGLVINSSLAGVGLAVPVVAASLLMLRSSRKKLPRWSGLAVGALTALAIALILTGPFGNNLTGDLAKTTEDSRYTSFSRTLEAAVDYAPLGSGIGTFPYVYRMYENPNAVTRIYMNHAHGDYFEVTLEMGLVGVMLVGLFLLWWGRRFVAIWTAEVADPFARAATIASAAILAHSAVDYPLRTAAVAAIFAACCALMAEPRPWGTRSKTEKSARHARHLSAD